MNSRAFGITLASVAGTPLLAAALIVACPSTTAAVIACLALAAGGAIGATASILLIGGGRTTTTGQRTATADLDASPDAETRKALLLLGDKIAGKDRA